MIYLVYLPIIIFIVIAVILSKKTKPKQKESIIFDSHKNIDYIKFDPYNFLNENDELEEKTMKKYINSFQNQSERTFVQLYCDYLLKNSFNKQNKTLLDERGRIMMKNGVKLFETVQKFIPHSTSYLLGFKVNEKFPNEMIDLYIEDVKGVGKANIQSTIAKVVSSARTKMADFDEYDGRFYSTITIKDVPINEETSKVEGIINVGSSYGVPIEWDYDKSPHLLVNGPTGSGKSVFMNYLLTQLLPQSKTYMVDFKEVDYSMVKDQFTEYYGSKPKDILDLVKKFKDEMEDAKILLKVHGVNHYRDLPENKKWKPKFLILEETPSMSISVKSWQEQEKVQKNYQVELDPNMPAKNAATRPSKYASPEYDFMNNLKQIILQGRAIGYQIIMIMQRADSDFIDTIIRDNCSLKVYLGATGDGQGIRMLGMTSAIVGLPLTGIGTAYVMKESKVSYANIPFYKKIGEKNE